MNKRFWAISIISIFILGMSYQTLQHSLAWSKEAEEMPQEDVKKALMIISHRNFRDEEFLEPKKILEEKGVKVVVASSNTDEAIGMFGLRYKPDITLSDVNTPEYSIVVFVGGTGSMEYWNDKTAHQIAREAVSLGKILGAICIAPVTLANAGLLNGKKATVFSSQAKALTDKGANYTGKEVEKDGLIITASGPSAAKKFGLALIEALSDLPNP